MSDNVYGFKLVNNLEVIGKVVQETDDFFELNDAMVIGFQQTQNGVSMQFVPFSPLMDLRDARHPGVNIRLYHLNVMASYRLQEEIVKEYCQATGSVIIASAF